MQTDRDRFFIAQVRKMYRGENEEYNTIAREIVWHVPGHNPVSGDYHGYEAYTQVMPSRMAPLEEWDFQLEDVMVNGYLVVTRFTVKGKRHGKMVDLRGGHLMRLNDQGQVVEGWGFTSDQDALDDFFTG